MISLTYSRVIKTGNRSERRGCAMQTSGLIFSNSPVLLRFDARKVIQRVWFTILLWYSHRLHGVWTFSTPCDSSYVRVKAYLGQLSCQCRNTCLIVKPEILQSGETSQTLLLNLQSATRLIRIKFSFSVFLAGRKCWSGGVITSSWYFIWSVWSASFTTADLVGSLLGLEHISANFCRPSQKHLQLRRKSAQTLLLGTRGETCDIVQRIKLRTRLCLG